MLDVSPACHCRSLSSSSKMQLRLERDVYRVLRDATAARALMTHPRNACLTLEGGCFHFLDHARAGDNKLVPLKGLTSILKAFYWPSYSPWAKSQSAVVKAIKRQAAERRRNFQKVHKSAAHGRVTKQFKTAQEAARGSVRGSIVHRQLGEWVRLDLATFMEHNPDGKHPLLKMALAAFHKAHMVPLAIEYRVAWTDGRLGTAIDAACVDLVTGVVHFVEIKTAQSRNLFFLDEPACPVTGLLGRLRAQHDPELPRAPCLHAKVQLAISVLMAKEGTEFRHPFKASVLLLAENEMEGEWIEVTPRFFRLYGEPLYEDIKKRMPEWRKEQRAAASKV